MAKAGSTHHVVLTTSGAGTETGLMLAHDPQTGTPVYAARRLPVLPDQPLLWEQTSWHLGFGDYLCRDSDPHRYAYSDGVDARYPNGLQLSPKFEGPLDILVRNPGGEQNSTTIWTAGSGVTYTNPTTNPHAGSRHHRMVTDNSLSSGAILISFSLANSAEFRGKEVVAFGHLAAGGSRQLRLDIYDGVGTTSSSVTTSSSYVYKEVTRTIDGSASEVTIRVVAADGDDSQVRTHDADDIHLIPASGDGHVFRMQPFAAGAGDDLYIIQGRMICRWDETKDVFECVLFDAAYGFENLSVHKSKLYASRGTTYAYSSTGSQGGWTTITPSAGRADFMVQGLTELDELVLFRLSRPNTVYVSTEADPIGASDWRSASYVVGESDKLGRTLYWAFDTLLVGREDGLWYYYSPSNAFRSATDGFRLNADAENFDRGIEYIDGWFYAVTARYGLVKMRFLGGDVEFETVGPSAEALMYDDFGGRVRALAHDGHWLYGAQDQPGTNDSATHTVNLMVASNMATPAGHQLAWHTLRALTMGTIGPMAVDDDFLYIAGGIYHNNLGRQYGRIFRMAIPTEHQSMMKDATVNVEDGGTKTWVSCVQDFADQGWAHHAKHWDKVDLHLENITSNVTVAVHEQHDAGISDSGSWTAVGSAITSVTAGWATVSFTVPTTAKRLRLRLTFVTNVTTTGPILRAFRVWATPSPDRYWEWDLTTRIATGMRGLQGQVDSRTAQNIIGNLETLVTEDAPLKYTDLDGTTYNVKMRVYDRIMAPMASGQGRGVAEHMEQRARLVLQEVQLS
jgi:hypothetical protein